MVGWADIGCGGSGDGMTAVAEMVGVFNGGPSHVGDLEHRLRHLYAFHGLILEVWDFGLGEFRVLGVVIRVSVFSRNGLSSFS